MQDLKDDNVSLDYLPKKLYFKVLRCLVKGRIPTTWAITNSYLKRKIILLHDIHIKLKKIKEELKIGVQSACLQTISLRVTFLKSNKIKDLITMIHDLKDYTHRPIVSNYM